jgi:rubrerythrin
MPLDIEDRPTWFCKECHSLTVHHLQRGPRPFMARFAEPDEEWWTCPRCGELDEDEVTEDELVEEDGDG